MKTWAAEWFAIIRKKHLYKDIKWSSQQVRDFNDFWIENYGKKISPRWHKLYQSMNGVFDVRYMPEMLFTTKLEPKLNPYLYSRHMSDKALVEIFASDMVEVPETVIVRNNGYYYDGDRKPVTENEAFAILSGSGDVVIKPALGGSSGQNVRILSIKNGVDTKTGQHVKDIVNEYDSFIVQKKILPHDSFAALYPNSINTIRIATYIIDGRVYHTPLAIRVGTGGNEVDNIHAGGIGIGVSDEGLLKKVGYKLGYGYAPAKFLEHPDTKVVFEGHKLSGIEKIIETAEKMHGRIPGLGMVSWDFTINDKNVPVLIEVNLLGQGIRIAQISNGQAVFGDNTGNILRHIKKRRIK
jgi:hypothetical protein